MPKREEKIQRASKMMANNLAKNDHSVKGKKASASTRKTLRSTLSKVDVPEVVNRELSAEEQRLLNVIFRE